MEGETAPWGKGWFAVALASRYTPVLMRELDDAGYDGVEFDTILRDAVKRLNLVSQHRNAIAY